MKRRECAARWGVYDASFNAMAVSHDLWLHAASVGELNAALNLYNGLCGASKPPRNVLITMLTPAGFYFAKKKFPLACSVVLLPYDTPLSVGRFLRRFNPQKLIIVENDMWPELLQHAHMKKIPSMCVSATLSPSSRQKRITLSFLVGRPWKHLRWMCVQTQKDASEYVKLGVSLEKVKVCGNLKFDTPLEKDRVLPESKIRTYFGKKRRIWIAASIHAQEVDVILDAHEQLCAGQKEALLILVPRYTQRLQYMTQKLAKRNMSYIFLQSVISNTKNALNPNDIQVVLGDSVGQMHMLYAEADFAFVGGSFINKGGHNPIEPAALKLPVLMGPHTEKAEDAVSLLQEAGSLKKINAPADLTEEVKRLMNQPATKLQVLGESGYAALQRKRADVQRMYGFLNDCL